MERWLVIGGSGFLGARVLGAIGSLGDRSDVHAISACRRPGDGAKRDGAELAELDLLSPELERRLAELGPTVCLLVAALSRGGDCERDPELAHELNVRAPERVAAWCASKSVRLVHVSTDLVFDGEPPRPSGYREDDVPRPLHAYGRSKAAGERAVLAACPGALVVRLPLLFGDSEGRALGASDALLAGLRGGGTARLFRDEWRTPLDVDDAARALLECGRAGTAGLLHVAGAQRMSRHEFGLAVLRADDPDRAPELEARVEAVLRADLGLVPPRPRDVSLDISRARRTLAWRPSDVQDALSRRRA